MSALADPQNLPRETHAVPRPTKPLAFGLALVTAPAAVALPFLVLLWLADLASLELGGIAVVAVFPVAAVMLGAPTYLLFGGVAYWKALRNGKSATVAGFQANLFSLPLVFLFYFLMTEPETAWGMLALYLIFGTIFSVIWSEAFLLLFRIFGGRRP